MEPKRSGNSGRYFRVLNWLSENGLPQETFGPNPEVVAEAKRRAFTAEYKQRILAEPDAATQPTAIGALFRHQGLLPPDQAGGASARPAFSEV